MSIIQIVAKFPFAELKLTQRLCRITMPLSAWLYNNTHQRTKVTVSRANMNCSRSDSSEIKSHFKIKKRMQPYFKNDFVIIKYDKVNHVIIHRWIDTITSAEFREGLNYLIPAMKLFKTGNIITDTTCMGIIHPDDQHWSVTNWFQKALKAGYSKVAIIVPDDDITRMSIEDTMNQARPFLFAYFDNMDEAIDWTKKLRII